MPSHDQKETTISDEETVRYLDGSALNRPLSVPPSLRLIMAAFVVVAAVIGGIFLYNVIDDVIKAPEREAEIAQENITREVSLDLPVLKDIIQLDDATIHTSLEEAGHTLHNLKDAEAPEGSGLDLIKLPEGVSTIDAGISYSKGIKNLSSAEAARLLNGSWKLSVEREDFVDMRIRYADFASGSVEAAVQNAVIAEGLEEWSSGELDVDDSGNTFLSGQIVVGETTYNWRVSACPLSEIYDIADFPSTAAYVVVRMHP